MVALYWDTLKYLWKSSVNEVFHQEKMSTLIILEHDCVSVNNPKVQNNATKMPQMYCTF